MISLLFCGLSVLASVLFVIFGWKSFKLAKWEEKDIQILEVYKIKTKSILSVTITFQTIFILLAIMLFDKSVINFFAILVSLIGLIIQMGYIKELKD